jgi:hypothetical protein
MRNTEDLVVAVCRMNGNCDICGYCSDVNEDPSLLGCLALLVRKVRVTAQFRNIRKYLLVDTASHSWACKGQQKRAGLHLLRVRRDFIKERSWLLCTHKDTV